MIINEENKVILEIRNNFLEVVSKPAEIEILIIYNGQNLVQIVEGTKVEKVVPLVVHEQELKYEDSQQQRSEQENIGESASN